MHVNEILKQTLKNKGIKKTWLAQQLDMPYSTLTGKFLLNTFTATELLVIAQVLKIDLNSWLLQYDFSVSLDDKAI